MTAWELYVDGMMFADVTVTMDVGGIKLIEKAVSKRWHVGARVEIFRSVKGSIKKCEYRFDWDTGEFGRVFE